jgi:hypothetical protein
MNTVNNKKMDDKLTTFFWAMAKEPIVRTIDGLLILSTALLMNKLSAETIKYSLDCDWHKIITSSFITIFCSF